MLSHDLEGDGDNLAMTSERELMNSHDLEQEPSGSESNFMLTAALSYAEHGFRVFPLDGKRPVTPHGFLDATTDRDTIRQWWHERPISNIGIPTGDGFAVLDIDPRHDGDEALRDLEEKYGGLPETLTVLTGGGGSHLYFRTNSDLPTRNIVGNSGLTLKARGGYVVAPPSIHPDTGRRYEFEDETAPVAELPEWLATPPERETRREPLDIARLASEGSPQGQRNHDLFRLACKLRSINLPLDVTLDLVCKVASQCQPPYPLDEARRIAERVYSTYPPGTYSVFDDLTLGEARPTVSKRRLINVADVVPQQVQWLWWGRIPLGKLTLLDGDPGVGKSSLTMDLTARVTKGLAMPDGSSSGISGPSAVLIWSAEDGVEDTIVPRLIAAWGNKELLWVWPNDEMPSIPDSIAELRQIIEEYGIRLFIIDPLMAYLGNGVQANRDQDVRRALGPLATMAEQTDCAVLMVRHLNKRSGEGNALYRGGGSIGIGGAARTVLLAARDKDSTDGDQMVLAAVKSNLSTKPPSLRYYIESLPTGSSRIVWSGETEITANDLLADRTGTSTVTAVEEAEAFLSAYLADGAKCPDEVKRVAKGHGIAEDTLNRAKRNLLVKTDNTGFGDTKAYYWRLPS